MKTGNFLLAIGFILILLMTGVEPDPHSFTAFWLHIGLVMFGVVISGSGVYLLNKTKR